MKEQLPTIPKIKKTICTATLEDDFSDDSVIVVISKNFSKINKRFSLSDFDDGMFKEITDLSAVDGNVDEKEYINTEDFKQIIKLSLMKPGKEEVLKAIKKLEMIEWIESAEPNYIYQICSENEENISLTANDLTIPPIEVNDPQISQQYALSRLEAQIAWNFETGKKDIRVGIIDSGIYNHEDLQSNLVKGWDFENNNSITNDDIVGHGTHVAGIIGAVGNNGKGVSGVCWNISLVPLQVTYDIYGHIHEDSVNRAIQYAANNNIPIINCSFGVKKNNNVYEAAMRNYKGLIVCSAGNDGTDNDKIPTYPSSSTLDNVVSVACINEYNELWEHSNYGATSVDIAAYGIDILSTHKNNNYVKLTGTSMAAPFVTGTAALILSYRPDLDASTIKEIILCTGRSNSQLSGKLSSSKQVLNICDAFLAVLDLSPPEEAIAGDVNGDGRVDLVSVGRHNYKNHGYINVQFATSSSSFGKVSYTSSRKVVNYNDDLWLEDINGDGMDDLVCRVGEGQRDTGYIYVALSTGSGFTFWTSHSNGRVVSPYDEILFGDVNGDGMQDIICRGAVNQSDYGWIYTALSNGNSFNFWSSKSSRKVVNHGDNLWIADVNGDNKDDIICKGDFAQSDAGYIYTALSGGKEFTFWSKVSSEKVIPNMDDRVWVGDVNGDGMADLIVQTGLNKRDTGYIWVALSNGSSFNFWSWNSGKKVVSETDEIMLGDVDGNGKIDLVVRGGSGKWDMGYIWTALSNGKGFTFWTSNTGKKVVNPRDRIFIGNINNDSKDDFIAIGGYGYNDQGMLWVAKSTGTLFDFWSWHGGKIGA